MAAARGLAAPPRRATPADRRASAARRDGLRVVRTDQRVRSVGTMGSIFVMFVFVTLFALAALHAVLVQTQARIDAIEADNQMLDEELEALIAQEAWLDSPAGLHEAATRAGLVEADDVATLVPVPDGALAPPASTDPFRGAAPDETLPGGDG